MDLELISFRICPFVQSSAMTLLHKKIPYRITHIDLASPPEWFNEISPLGKVPLLKVDGEVLFESAVINEFIDEATPGSMLPESPLERAKCRAWIEYFSGLLGAIWQVTMAKDEAAFMAKRAALRSGIARIESDAQIDGPLFNGPELSLVDCAVTPFWQRLDIANRHTGLLPLGEFPRVSAWSAACLALPETSASSVDDLENLYLNYIKSSGSHLAQQISL